MNAEAWTILAVGIALGGLIIALGGLVWQMLRSFRRDMDRRFEQVDRQFAEIRETFAAIDRRFEQIAECFRGVRRQLARLADDHNGLARELSELRGEIRGRLDERAPPRHCRLAARGRGQAPLSRAGPSPGPRVSSQKVTGPSLHRRTCIRSPNRPHSTAGWRSVAHARKWSKSLRAVSGWAPVLKPGRVPLRVSAGRVNCGTASSPPPVSARLRFIRPFPSGNIR